MIDRLRRPGLPGAWFALVAALVLLGACGGSDTGNAGATDDDTQVAGDRADASRSACDVLTGADVSRILGQTLEARPDPEEQTPRYSSCGYYPGEGYGVLYLTAYWSGGRDEWDSWQMATSYAGQMWEQAEKVDLDSITGASLVSGLGDRAWFGGIMPSLVLVGDVLLEFKLALVTDESHNFPLLAKAALARLK
jgi:hypothetical protein